MNLGERLDKLRAERSAVAELHEPYEATIRQLGRTGFLDFGLAPRQHLPRLPDAECRGAAHQLTRGPGQRPHGSELLPGRLVPLLPRRARSATSLNRR